MVKVAKFGGSSVANSEQFKKVKKIIEADRSRKYVVTSACGKEKKEDYKVTDLLYLTHAHFKYGVDFQEIFSLVEKKYKSIVQDLNLKLDIEKEFDDIKDKITSGATIDYLVSRGEYLAGLCLSEYLGYEFLDAKNFIMFDYNGKINLDKSKEFFDKIIDKNKSYVIPGFYGSMPDGDIRVMSRGGSDITGSLVANIVDAVLYENWTDVSGILVCDPRIVDNPKHINYISYDELREISYMGANVLHDEAIYPAKIKNIPINIRNTNDMNSDGTMILADCSEADKKIAPPLITGITGKKNFNIITVTKINMSNQVGVISKALNILSDYNISIESAPGSIDSFWIIVEEKNLEKYQYEVVSKLKKELDTEDVTITKDIALVAAVGRGFRSRIGLAGKIFKTLGDNGINIRTITQGSDEIIILIGVDNKDFEKSINCIYDNFVRNEK